MHILDFTPQDLDALHFERFHHPHPRVPLKMEAVDLKSQGLAHLDIGRRARISENTLRSYLRQYQEGGVARLQQTDGDGPTRDLSDHRQTIEEHFRKNPPRSTAQAAADIERLTGVRRGLTQVRKFLKGLGLKFRKRGMIPAQADAEVPRKFLDERLRPRLRPARRLRRVVGFVAAAHFVHGAFLGYLGCVARLLIRGPSGRKRFHVLGAIAAVTRELTTLTNDTTIDGTAIGELLRKLSARDPGLPLTLVLDHARYQRCEPVRLLAAELRIELLDLVSYSPNRNLIERLWKFVTKEVLTGRYYGDFARFKAAIIEGLEQVEGKHSEAIASLLTLKFQTFDNTQLLAA
jgi:transposase